VAALLAPLTARTTWRRWGHLILGGALLMPYMMAGAVLAGMVNGPGQGASLSPLLAVQIGIFLAVLPAVLLTGLVLPVRALETTAAAELLGAPVHRPPPDTPRTWRERWRTAIWFTLHLAMGGLVSGVTLAMLPFGVWLLTLPVAGDAAGLVRGIRIGPGAGTLWAVPAGVAVLLGTGYLAAGAGALLARIAPVLLGPSPADRLAELERQAGRLAERNRLARELHDSVGHALSVVTLQAEAAGRVLDRDPAAARTALAAVAASARAALADLDHVLGLLREDDRRPAAPQPTLRDLAGLLDQTRQAGTEVRAELAGTLDAVPAAVSREAYRIVQEGLTNALRHAGPVPVTLRLDVHPEELELDDQPAEPARRAGMGRGGHPATGRARTGRDQGTRRGAAR
jgi:signal transduction histidine kinase